MTDPPWAELPLTSVGHRPLRVRGQALPELPLLLLGHIQTKVLQNLEQKQEAFKKENTGKAPLWGKHWEDTWCWVSAGSISQRSRVDWISSLSFPARVQKCLLLNTGSHPSKNILSAIRFAALMSFQDFYQKPEEF